MVKNLPANAGDSEEASWIPGSGRSPSVGNGNPLQCSCLENKVWLYAVGEGLLRVFRKEFLEKINRNPERCLGETGMQGRRGILGKGTK